jgi:hypothetical protein
MNVTAELNEKQVDCMDLSIKVTMTVSQWRHIRSELMTSQEKNWSGTKADFLDAIRDTISGMTGKMTGEYPNNGPQK